MKLTFTVLAVVAFSAAVSIFLTISMTKEKPEQKWQFILFAPFVFAVIFWLVYFVLGVRAFDAPRYNQHRDHEEVYECNRQGCN